MSLESYCFDISSQPPRFVRSFDDPSPIDFPIFAHTDSRDFGITFIKRATTRKVQVIEATFGAAFVLTDPANNATVLCQATAGAASGNEYPFVLNLSSAALTTFMTGVVSAPKLSDCQIKLTTANGPNRFDTKLMIAPAKAADVAIDSAAPDRGIGFNEAAGIYIPKEWPAGGFMIVRDEADGAMFQVRVFNKQFRFEPIG